jgi:hypothetical protein
MFVVWIEDRPAAATAEEKAADVTEEEDEFLLQ